MNNTIIIILGAGKGARMQSELPKVLHKINNKPMIEHVVDVAKNLNPEKIIVVVGYKKELVIESLKENEIIFVEQKNQNGTADAIKECIPAIKNSCGDILILSGDVPLIRTSTLESFINLHNNKKALGSLISAELPDATGYGRIIKNNKGQLIKIIEHKDATNQQKEINEINSGIYIINSKVLNQKISLIDNDNKQQEYYLTDIFNFIDENDTSIYKIKNYHEVSGINNIDQLENLNNS